MTEQDRTSIATRVGELEARTGTQVVTAVVGKSDSYPEAPWACVMWQLAAGGWSVDASPTGHVLVILGSGAFLALLTILFSPFARLFIDRTRRDVEVTQFAQSLFFRRGLDRTRGRVGILLLISLFERKVVILADEGFDGRVDVPDWGALTSRITLLLRHATIPMAMRAGLEGMEAMLLERGFTGPGLANDMPDGVLEIEDER